MSFVLQAEGCLRLPAAEDWQTPHDAHLANTCFCSWSHAPQLRVDRTPHTPIKEDPGQRWIRRSEGTASCGNSYEEFTLGWLRLGWLEIASISLKLLEIPINT